MWILYAIGSSFFAGITAILAKCAVLRGTKMMSALAEMGFISNSTESARIDARSEAIGSALYQSLCNSFN